MTSIRKSILILGGAVLAVAAGVVISQRRVSDAQPGDNRPSTTAGAGALPSLPSAVDPPPTVPPPEPLAARVPKLMEDWRAAIVSKNAETVEALDRAFASHPQEFIAALMASAESDPEERVRSFSTRVLGKLRANESLELMNRLLSDRSEYVRFNAAWALGELSDRNAVARLRQLKKADPSPTVRQSAEESLRRMEGG